MDDKINKCNNIIETMRRFSIALSRSILDYADIISDKPYNSSFKEKLEAVQFNACSAITSAIRRTSHERLYREL